MMEVESGCEWEAAAPGCCWRARTLPAADPCTVPIRASQRHGWPLAVVRVVSQACLTCTV